VEKFARRRLPNAYAAPLEGEMEGKVKIEGFHVNSREFSHFEEISNALIRLDKGTYGRCARCGRRIESVILAEAPWATGCLECGTQPPQP
jgi:RNA polymerase-binding transcription factor DksA